MAVRIGGRRFYFLGWDGLTPDNARGLRDALGRLHLGEVRIVAPYSADELRSVPPGVPDLAPQRLWYRPIE